jgi:hypothetical protein
MKNVILLALMGMILFSCNKDDDDGPNSNSGSNIPAEFRAFKELFNGNGIGAAVNLKDDVILLFNIDGDQYAWFEKNEIKAVFDLDDTESAFRSSSLETVGAAGLMSETRLVVFDAAGENFTFADFNANNVSASWDDAGFFSWTSQSNPISEWGDGNYALDGLSALWNLSNTGDTCLAATVQIDIINMVDGNGNTMQPFSAQGNFFSNGPFPTQIFTARNNCGGDDGIMPFDRIGSACSYVDASEIKDIIFNAEGNQFTFYTVSEGVFSEIYDLY